MLSKRENFLETIKKDGKPDRLIKQFEGTTFLPGDPVNTFVRGNRYPGMPEMKDLWGTTIVWPEGSIGAMPHVTEANKVVRDITCWRDFTKVPDLIANCSAEEAWGPYLERAAKVDRSESLLMMFAPTGVFERTHFLMGFEDTFLNIMLEEEAFADLEAAIGEYRYNGMKLMTDAVHPDIMLSHDDWGSKTNLFMRPDQWREFINPNYEKAYNYMHDAGVIIMHHSDSFCEPIVEDMIDLHIDIWQGVLPQNDIPRISKEIDGRMCLMGGIDAAIVDRADSTEEEIRAEVRRVCDEYGTLGHFIPCITYGGPGTVYPNADKFIDDEIDRYNEEHFGFHS
ncbi:MAG: uroporphyrinogen decarboxylase (URO-D) [Oscillospiraceae bacterium]|nr:uroporphyrinogen decarboxylase (URO-D) [Oscillospiraceae bacterium]